MGWGARNWYLGTAISYANLDEAINPLTRLNDALGRMTNVQIVIDVPDKLRNGMDFLSEGGHLGNALTGLGLLVNGVEVIDGLSETWSEGRSVDVLDVLNPFGSVDDGTYKIRHGLASAALTGLGLVAGTALAPVVVTAGVVAFVSDVTGSWQESFWVWWDDLDVTGERLQGSAWSNSQDPNQKLGVNGYGDAHYVSRGTRLTYRIDSKTIRLPRRPPRW